MDRYSLKLYVTGQSASSERARRNLRRLLEEELSQPYELTIIDVLEQPQLAEADKIFATPTLIKESPPPVRRIVGDLSRTEKVRLWLDLQPDVIEYAGEDS